MDEKFYSDKQFDFKQLLLWSDKKKFYPYWRWEDFKAGMYKPYVGSIPEDHIQSCLSLLGVYNDCRAAMMRVVSEWPIATSHQLSDSSKNRRPWLGRASCCITSSVREDAVKQAWWILSEEKRCAANRAADEVIAIWEQNNE